MRRVSDAPERYLVRQALLSVGTRRPWFREAVCAERDWELVFAIAHACDAIEPVWAGIEIQGMKSHVPGDVRERFEAAQDRAAVQNAVLLARSAAVQEALEAAGIDSMLVGTGGLVLAHYPDRGDRRMERAVLLMRARDGRRADAVVRKVQAGIPKLASIAQSGPCSGLEMRLVEPSGHRSVLHLESCFESSRPVPWEGKWLRVSSIADLAAEACLELARHDRKSPSPALADLAVAMGSGALAWKEVESRLPPSSDFRAFEAARRLLDVGPRPGWADLRYAVQVLLGGK